MTVPNRLGDKDLPFSECDECGVGDTVLYPAGGAWLCAVCLEDR